LRSQAASLLVRAGQVEQAVPTLLQLLQSEDDSLRSQAASLLIDAGQVEQAVPTLLQLLQSEDDSLRSQQAASLLVRTGQTSPGARKALIAAALPEKGDIARMVTIYEAALAQRSCPGDDAAGALRDLFRLHGDSNPDRRKVKMALFDLLWEACHPRQNSAED